MGDVRLIGIFGGLGTYKTALATPLALMYSQAFDIGIVANYKIKVPQAQELDMSELVGVEYIDKVLVEDEVYSLADSRCSMSEKNIYYTYSIAQARKSPVEAGGRGIGNYVIYTAQLTSMADIRLFELTNLYIMTSKDEFGNCHYEWVNDEGVVGSNDLPRSWFERFSFPYYSTHEKIDPLGIESLRVSMEKYNPSKINARIDRIVAEIMIEKKNTWSSFKDIKSFTVNDFIRRKGYPEKLARGVFERCCEMVRLGEGS